MEHVSQFPFEERCVFNKSKFSEVLSFPILICLTLSKSQVHTKIDKPVINVLWYSEQVGVWLNHEYITKQFLNEILCSMDSHCIHFFYGRGRIMINVSYISGSIILFCKFALIPDLQSF